ncbi:MAG TPA: WhiB family transcriptional regulator [Mycolicibacterium fallax]|nr:WhiB family transcriptional regulator [Mycolicibacterium fallax]
MRAARPPAQSAEDWDWQLRARCRGLPAETFFTTATEKGRRRDEHEETAKAICRRCPVLRRCLDYALAADETYGIWGATTPGERRALRPPDSAAQRAAG